MKKKLFNTKKYIFFWKPAIRFVKKIQWNRKPARIELQFIGQLYVDHLTYQHTKLIWILPPTTAVAEFQSTLVCVASFQKETKITTRWFGCPQNMQQLAENCNIISSYCFPLNLLFHHALYYRIIHSTDGRMACSSVHFTLIYLHLNFFYSLIPCCCSCRFFFAGWSIELYNTTHHIDTRSNWSRFGL